MAVDHNINMPVAAYINMPAIPSIKIWSCASLVGHLGAVLQGLDHAVVAHHRVDERHGGLFGLEGVLLVALALVLLEERLLDFGEGHLHEQGAERPEQHAEHGDGHVEGEDVAGVVVEVDALGVGDVQDEHVVDEIGPEGYLADVVEELGVGDEEHHVVLDAQQTGRHQQRHAHHEEQLGRGQVQRVHDLRPLVAHLQSAGDVDDEEDDGQAQQLGGVLELAAGLELLLDAHVEALALLGALLLFDELHVEEAENEAEEVGRAADPWLDVDVGEVGVPLLEVAAVGDCDVLVDLDLDEVVDEGEEDEAADGAERDLPVLGVQEQDGDGGDEDLHVVLQVPAPPHAHALPVVHDVVHEDYRLPHRRAVVDLPCPLHLEPQRPAPRVDEDPVVDQHGHDVGGPEAQDAVHNRQRVLDPGLHLVPEEGVGHQEAPDVEEDVDCEEGGQHPHEERPYHLSLHRQLVHVVLDPHRVQVAQDHPHHAERSDPVEDIELVLLVLEYLEGLVQVEGPHELGLAQGLHQSGGQHTHHVDAQQSDGEVEGEPELGVELLRRLEVLGDDARSHGGVGQDAVRRLFDFEGATNVGQAEAHVDADGQHGGLVDELQQPVVHLRFPNAIVEQAHLGDHAA